ncbi:glycosyltransferase family 2 protein [Plesiomonas shigelloides]|uniref:Glycosyltransferase family 2 protein n=1 Tax=Plesiomonas shigelloides TaxID=703 RepID=A0A4D6U7U4_PLESH|nr:glycosyltransferase family 2 protein [Plesiomonas shigelloides]QCH03284.1 glycosyltransferase family 2 protein [Plesiomonas shigelloides]
MVLFNPDKVLLSTVVDKILEALDLLSGHYLPIELIVIDNSSEPSTLIKEYIESIRCFDSIKYISRFDNPGFGIAHNHAIRYGEEFRYHLILNPDLDVAPDALKSALEFMEQHPECGLLTPYATWGDGQVQRLCKRYPTVLDLFLRGFMPKFFRDLFAKRLSHYEMSDTLNDKDVYWDPPIVSGCFMLFRTEVLKKVGGFDPRFFLYFEDFDISLRTAKVSRIAYVPQVKVVHHGGHASRKGWRHIKMFGRSMITFFNIHGWRWW